VRIYEILFWNNEPKENHSDPQLDLRQARYRDALTKLADAHATDWLVKHFWNLERSEYQPSGPAMPDAGTEFSQSGTLEPTTTSGHAEPVETEPPVGRLSVPPYASNPGIPLLLVDSVTRIAGHWISRANPTS
jgi:hypothetical protein